LKYKHKEINMAVRTVVQIDEDLCDGCGDCVPGCAEGALQIVDGKAKLVSDVYCDGLGACLGECPLGAISMVEREADEFDVEATNEHLKSLGREAISEEHGHDHGHDHVHHAAHDEVEMDEGCACAGTAVQSFEKPVPKAAPAAPMMGGCPGSAARSFTDAPAAAPAADDSGPVASRISNWPVQLMLVPPKAPYLDGAKLLLAADCAPFAYGDFHRKFMDGRVTIIGCPKLDNMDIYIQKLTSILAENDVKSVELAYMEVPCCGGLVQLVQQALADSGKNIPAILYKIGIRGDYVEERSLSGAAA
jgi:ferredoxin